MQVNSGEIVLISPTSSTGNQKTYASQAHAQKINVAKRTVLTADVNILAPLDNQSKDLNPTQRLSSLRKTKEVSTKPVMSNEGACEGGCIAQDASTDSGAAAALGARPLRDPIVFFRTVLRNANNTRGVNNATCYSNRIVYCSDGRKEQRGKILQGGGGGGRRLSKLSASVSDACQNRQSWASRGRHRFTSVLIRRLF